MYTALCSRDVLALSFPWLLRMRGNQIDSSDFHEKETRDCNTIKILAFYTDAGFFISFREQTLNLTPFRDALPESPRKIRLTAELLDAVAFGERDRANPGTRYNCRQADSSLLPTDFVVKENPPQSRLFTPSCFSTRRE